MFGIHAGRDTTQVVDNKTVRNRSDEMLVRKAMGKNLPPIYVESTVAAADTTAVP